MKKQDFGARRDKEKDEKNNDNDNHLKPNKKRKRLGLCEIYMTHSSYTIKLKSCYKKSNRATEVHK